MGKNDNVSLAHFLAHKFPTFCYCVTMNRGNATKFCQSLHYEFENFNINIFWFPIRYNADEGSISIEVNQKRIKESSPEKIIKISDRITNKSLINSFIKEAHRVGTNYSQVQNEIFL